MSEVKGKIIEIGQEESVGSSGFRKRLLVVETAEQYPQQLPIEFVQDKCDLLNPLKAGQDVKVQINLRGRSWTNPEGVVKYFPSFQGWRIEADTDQPKQEPAHANNSNDGDDLPF